MVTKRADRCRFLWREGEFVPKPYTLTEGDSFSGECDPTQRGAVGRVRFEKGQH